MRECPKCGYRLDPFDRSCPKCARRAAEAPQAAPDEAPEAPAAPRRPASATMWAVAGGGLVLLAAALLFVYSRHAPSGESTTPGRPATGDSRWQTAERDPSIDPLANYTGSVIAVNNPQGPDMLVRTVGPTERIFIVSPEGRADIPASVGSYTIRYMFAGSDQVYETDPFAVFSAGGGVTAEITLRRGLFRSSGRRVSGGL